MRKKGQIANSKRMASTSPIYSKPTRFFSVAIGNSISLRSPGRRRDSLPRLRGLARHHRRGRAGVREGLSKTEWHPLSFSEPSMWADTRSFSLRTPNVVEKRWPDRATGRRILLPLRGERAGVRAVVPAHLNSMCGRIEGAESGALSQARSPKSWRRSVWSISARREHL